MTRRLAAQGLREIPVGTDGGCLFRSISAALNNGSEASFVETRAKIANWLEQNENLELMSSFNSF